MNGRGDLFLRQKGVWHESVGCDLFLMDYMLEGVRTLFDLAKFEYFVKKTVRFYKYTFTLKIPLITPPLNIYLIMKSDKTRYPVNG